MMRFTIGDNDRGATVVLDDEGTITVTPWGRGATLLHGPTIDTGTFASEWVPWDDDDEEQP